MKRIFTTLLTVGLLGAGFAGNSLAQTAVKTDKPGGRTSREAAAASSLYIISAKAGAVNYVSGKVAIDKKGAKSGYLIKGDNIEQNEIIRTGSAGRAEVLLNPGSYMRIAENSTFKFDSTALDDLRLNLSAGSAIFEVAADKEFTVTVNTPKSRFELIKSGIYRVDTLGDGTAKISVWKGRATYGTGKKDVVKGGQATAIVNGQTAVQKFDRDAKGEFEIWSKDRAKEIAKVNARLQQKAMSRSLIYSFAQNPWGRSNGFGLWVFDAGYSGYCFLPFGAGWSSPYGYDYSRSIWNYNLPNAIYSSVNPYWNNSINQESNQNNGNNFPNQNNNFPSPANGGGSSSPIIGGRPSSAPMSMPDRTPSIVERKADTGERSISRPIDQ